MSSKITVLHLRSSGDILGAENVILEIVKNSKTFGCYAIIGVIKDFEDPIPPFLKVAQSLGLPTVVFENRKIFDFNCATTIREYIYQNNVDVLHCHGYKEDFFGVLSRVKIPKLATNHLWKNNTIKLKAYRYLDILLLRSFDRVVGVSTKLTSEMTDLGIKNVSNIANGIDLKKYVVTKKSLKIYEQFSIPSDVIVLGMVSSLTPEKNHKIVLECLEKLKNLSLVLLIVGSGNQKKNLEELVISKGLEQQVFFLGRQENIPEILSIVDIYLLPSLVEGLPMSLLEAMACSKAVIVSRVGENENIISHKENGLLVSPGNVSELETAIEQLVQNCELIKAYGERARETVEGKFSSELMTRDYCRLYVELSDR